MGVLFQQSTEENDYKQTEKVKKNKENKLQKYKWKIIQRGWHLIKTVFFSSQNFFVFVLFLVRKNRNVFYNYYMFSTMQIKVTLRNMLEGN